MEPHWDLIARIIKESDLVLEVLDARLVELSRNEQVEKLINEIGRPLIFVINKSDLVSRENLKKQVNKLRKELKNGEVVFISAKRPRDIKILLYAIKRVFKKYGKSSRDLIDYSTEGKQKFREAKGKIVVGILGYPNVGKSSIINSLAHKKKVKVSKKPGTTHGIHWVRISDEIKLIDSPGVIPLLKEDEVRYGLIGAKDTEALRNPEIVAYAVIKLFLKENKKNFEKFYGIEINNFNNLNIINVEEIIHKLGEKRNFLLKEGKIDEHRTCSIIVRDWQQGKLRL